MRVGIIGGGAAGLAAAYDLTKAGHYAQVFEQAPFLGGQGSTFAVGGGRVERGYHHLFVSDTDITDFNLLAANFSPAGYATSAIPEPTSLLLASLAVVLVSVSCRLSKNG